MSSDTTEYPNVCNVPSPKDDQRLVHITLEEEIFTRAVALLAKHPDWDLSRLANEGLWGQIRRMEIDDAYPEPEPTPYRSEHIEETTVADHVETSHCFLQEAQTELNASETSLAIGMVWDSLAHALGAIAVNRGWDYQASIDIAMQLSREFDRSHCYDQVEWIKRLEEQVDFWGRELLEDEGQDAIDKARALVQELDELRERQPGPFTIECEEDKRRLARLLDIPTDQRDQELPIGAADPSGFSYNPTEDGT